MTNTYPDDVSIEIKMLEETRCLRCVLERILRVMDEGLFVDYQMEKFGKKPETTSVSVLCVCGHHHIEHLDNLQPCACRHGGCNCSTYRPNYSPTPHQAVDEWIERDGTKRVYKSSPQQPECEYCAGTGEESPTKRADVPLVSCHVCYGTGRQPAPQNPIKLGSDEMFAEMDRIVAEVEQQNRGCDNCFESLKGPCGLPDCGPPEYPRWCKRYPRESCPVCGHNQHEGRCGVMDDGIHPCQCNQPAPRQQPRCPVAVGKCIGLNCWMYPYFCTDPTCEGAPKQQQREGGSKP